MNKKDQRVVTESVVHGLSKVPSTDQTQKSTTSITCPTTYFRTRHTLSNVHRLRNISRLNKQQQQKTLIHNDLHPIPKPTELLDITRHTELANTASSNGISVVQINSAKIL